MKSCCTTLGLGIVLFLAGESYADADNVYVSDSTGGTILRFNSSGAESVFASGLDQPAGLAFADNGDLYVADSGNGTILEFDRGGAESVFASGLSNPTGLAVDGSGNLYVANSGAGTILRFNSNGNGSVFASGLYDPGYLAVDGSGNLYASTPRTVMGFDASGNPTTIFSPLNYVYGLAPGSAGNLYVSLQNAGSIVQLSGGVVTGGIAFGDPLHTAPTGLAFGSGDVLYAAFGGVGGTYNPLGGTIEAYGPGGDGTLFASGLDNPQYLAVQGTQGIQTVQFVPEPSGYAMAIAGMAVLLVRRGWFQRRA
ncbi:MAG TPA: NHL repeat-containing protein [Verrucomicrobiae bacterium]|nr:NHL repeat-containing protein [Verrucomicrobiae bacterium]